MRADLSLLRGSRRARVWSRSPRGGNRLSRPRYRSGRLYFALRAAEHGRVVVVTQTRTNEANTQYAQVGSRACSVRTTAPEQHIQDTLTVGDGLCRRDVVERCVREGPRPTYLHLANQIGSSSIARAWTARARPEGGHSARGSFTRATRPDRRSSAPAGAQRGAPGPHHTAVRSPGLDLLTTAK